MKPIVSIVVMVLVLVQPVAGQTFEQPATPKSETAQSVWRGISWGALGAGVAFDAIEVLQEPNRKKAITREVLIFTGTNLATWAAKSSREKARPCAPADCGSDDPYRSWWSGHAGNACAAIPMKGGPAVAIVGGVLAFMVIEGRILGNRHWPIDTAMGCAEGLANKIIISRLMR